MGKMKVANANKAGAQQQSQQESVNALEMHLHLLGLTAELHTDPKPPLSTEFFPGLREGRVEQRERTRLITEAVQQWQRAPREKEKKGEAPGDQQEGEDWWQTGRMCPVHQSPRAAPS